MILDKYNLTSHNCYNNSSDGQQSDDNLHWIREEDVKKQWEAVFGVGLLKNIKRTDSLNMCSWNENENILLTCR